MLFATLVVEERLAREGMEITVVDDSDYVGWLASATRIDEIHMTNVESMVNNVVKRANSQGAKIRRLNVLDHGNDSGIEIGEDWITVSTLPQFTPHLGRLKGHFHSSGFTHFQHCNVGSNHELLKKLSSILGVPVYAGTGKHNPVYRFNFGQYDRCIPSGKCEADVGRP